MTIHNKAFPFATTVEGFTGYPESGDIVMSYDGVIGNPAGSLKSRISGRNKNGVSYWEWVGTWEDLGIPSGSTVSQIRLNGVDNRCTEWDTADTATIGPISVYNSAGDTLIATLWTGRSPTGSEGSWTSIGTQSYQSVNSAYEDSATTIRVRIYNTLDLANSSSAAISVQDDNLSLDIDYLATIYNLTATGITTTPVLSDSTVGQEHNLTATGITADPVLGTPTATHIHNLTATGITADPVLGTPTATHIHNLTATGITADPVLGTPAIGQTHNLTATGITADPVLGTPTVAHIHDLTATSIDSTPVLDTPTLTSESTEDELTATSISTTPVLGTPTIGQTHDLTATGITADPILGTPTIGVSSTGGLTIAIAPFTTPTSNGDQTITTTDLGGLTPKAAFFVLGVNTAENTKTAHSQYAIGAATGPDEEWAVSQSSRDNWSGTDTQRYIFNDSCIRTIWAVLGQTVEANFKNFTTNGCTITWTDTHTSGLKGYAVFFAGTDLQARAGMDTGPTSGGSVDITSPGFQPNLVMMSMSGSTASSSEKSYSYPGFGASADKATDEHGTIVSFRPHSVSSAATVALANVNDSYAELSGAWTTYSYRVTDWDSNGFTFTHIYGASATEAIGWLALDTGSHNVAVQMFQHPTSTGSESFTGLGFKPQAAIIVQAQTDNIGTSPDNGINASSIGIGAVTENDEFTLMTSDKDNVSTTVAKHTMATKAIYVTNEEGDADVEATLESWDSDGFTLDYTNVRVDSPYFLVIAFEEDTAGGDDDLTATGITTTPVLDTPTIGQTHVLDAVDISTTPVLDTPTIGQTHVLDAVDISTTPVLDTPSIGQEHDLTATGITVNPVLGTPTVTDVPAAADPVLEQSKVYRGTGDNMPLDILLDNSVKEGSLLVVACNVYNGSAGNAIAVDDDNLNSWQVGHSEQYSTPDHGALWYAFNVNAGVTTITIDDINGDNLYVTAVIMEFSGVETTSPVDQTNEQTGSGSSWNSGSITTTQDKEVLVGVVAQDYAVVTHSEDTPWVLVGEEDDQSTYMPISVSYIIATSTVTDNYGGGFDITVNNWWSAILSFKAGAAGTVDDLTATGVLTTPVLETPTIGQTHVLGAVDISSTPVLGIPAIGQKHVLDSVDISTTPVLENPTIGQTHVLDSADISTTPVLENPTIGQTHVLDSSGITVDPVVGTPALGQEHVLTASDISTNPVLGTPTLTDVPPGAHNLIATGITVEPVVDTPALGQEHGLTTSDITTDPVVDTPSLGQEHFLAAIDTTTTPVLDAPSLAEIHVLDTVDITSTPVLDTPTVGQTHVLDVVDITSTPVLGTPSMSGEHTLDAVDISTTPVLETPTVGQEHVLDASEITADPVLGTSTIGQIHALDASEITADPVLGTPSMSGEQSLSALGISAIPVLGTPSIGQIHDLDSSDITTTSVLDTPSMGGEHDLDAADITITPVLDTPVLAHTYILEATNITTTPVVELSTVGQGHSLDAVYISTTPVVEDSTIEQTHALLSVGVEVVPVVETSALAHIHVLGASDLYVTPEIDISSISQTHLLDPSNITVTSILETSDIGQIHVLYPNGIITTPATGRPAWELIDGIVDVSFGVIYLEVAFDSIYLDVDFEVVYPEVSFETIDT